MKIVIIVGNFSASLYLRGLTRVFAPERPSMSAFKVKLTRPPSGPLKSDGQPLAASLMIDAVELRSQLVENIEGILGKELMPFFGMHLYLEINLDKPPFYLETGIFGPLSASELARLNNKFLPLARADIDMSIDNDEDPFTGGRMLRDEDFLPWIEEARAQEVAMAIAPKANAISMPAKTPARTIEKLGEEVEARQNLHRPYLIFHVDGHGDEGRRGSSAGRTIQAKKYLELMKEAALFIDGLYSKALQRLDAEAQSIIVKQNNRAG